MDWYASRTDVELSQLSAPPANDTLSKFVPFWRALQRAASKSSDQPSWKMTNASLWVGGIACVGAAVALFVLVALSLCFLLLTSREKFQIAQHEQSVLMQAVALQEDLDNATSAARRYLVNRRQSNIVRLNALTVSANTNMGTLMEMLSASPATAGEIRALAPAIESRLTALQVYVVKPDDQAALNTARAKLLPLVDQTDEGLESFRAARNAALGARLNQADDRIRLSIWLALFGAIAGPGLGLAGMWLLSRARGSQRLRQMQSEMMHVQRLAVMGETAAMLAHDVSHPLTAANNYLGALRRLTGGKPEHDRVADLAGRAATQITRASEILLRLRRFIEKREAERQLESPSAVLEDAVALLGPLDSDVRLKLETDPSLPPLLVDRVQIQQVLVNLMRNAVEATEGCPRRELSVSVSANDRHGVLFRVADSGRGLTPDIAESLFRPFVSSKRDGMGIGLTICRNIIFEHNGRIWAEPNPGGGTIFQFSLPAAAEAAA